MCGEEEKEYGLIEGKRISMLIQLVCSFSLSLSLAMGNICWLVSSVWPPKFLSGKVPHTRVRFQMRNSLLRIHTVVAI